MTTLEKLTPVLQDVFDDDNLVASRDLTADKVTGWDSITNVRLFLAVEQTFGLRFSAAEMGLLKNLGELADLIDKKKAR